VSAVHELQPGDEPSAARRFRMAAPATATALGILALVLLGATVTLAAFDHQATFLNLATGIPVPLVYAAVGVIVARHQLRNAVGWILILFVVLFLIWVDAGFYAVLRYRLGHHGLPLGPAAVVLTSLWPLAFALFPLVILLFPDGRLTSRRWRWVLCGYAVAVAYIVVVTLAPALAAAASHDIQVNSSGDISNSASQAGWAAQLPAGLTAVAYLAIGVISLSFVGHQVLSWRRAAGERRQQLKWLAWPVTAKPQVPPRSPAPAAPRRAPHPRRRGRPSGGSRTAGTAWPGRCR
jgi:two-component system, NarL family, sensor kinase